MSDEICRCNRDVTEDQYGWWCTGCMESTDQCSCTPIREVGETWYNVDLGPVFDGQETDPAPLMLGRDDDRYLFYNGKIHTVSGESESLKTWLVLVAVADVINHGYLAVFIDYEDSAAGIVGRLKTLGCSRKTITTHLYYVRPDEP